MLAVAASRRRTGRAQCILCVRRIEFRIIKLIAALYLVSDEMTVGSDVFEGDEQSQKPAWASESETGNFRGLT